MLTFHSVSLSFGTAKLLDVVDFRILANERICLIGRNGEGKSSLLKIIAGDCIPDAGTIHKIQGLKIAILNQEVFGIDTHTSVFDTVANGLEALGKIIIEYHTELTKEDNNANPDRLVELQHQIDAMNGWSAVSQIETVISKLSLDANAYFDHLSGGLKRRVLLAKALVNEPDILLLDEPTNHLDIDAIAWLEKLLLNYKKTIVFVSHDRAFLQKLATRIVELDRGQLYSYDCDYSTYLLRKEELIATQEKAAALFDKQLADEEKWIRQGVKARRTRNEGRVRNLIKMRENRQQRREAIGTAKLQAEDCGPSGKMVIEANKLCFSHAASTPIINNFSCTIVRGDKIGLVGPNGCGKTTLLNLLLGELSPTQGTIKHGTNLDIAYFDQLRSQLNDEASVIDNLAEGRREILINGKSKHVISYLKDFLFSPPRAQTPVKVLSGGERNRLLLAKLFAKPANLLVLDEPTNDLDLETLELLESLLVEFAGTVILVSHDRVFLDNVVTSTIAFEGNATFREYVGGYEDLLRQRQLAAKSIQQPADKLNKAKEKAKTTATKLSYKEQRELDALPLQIEQLEAEVAGIQQKMTQTDFYQQSPTDISQINKQLQSMEVKLAEMYERWGQLEKKSEP